MASLPAALPVCKTSSNTACLQNYCTDYVAAAAAAAHRCGLGGVEGRECVFIPLVVFRHGVYQYGLWGESDALYVGASGRTPVRTGQRHSPTVGTLHCRRARGGRLQRGMVVGAMSQVRCSNETNGDPQRSLSPSFFLVKKTGKPVWF